MRTSTSNRGWRWQEVLLEGVRISSSANRHGLVTCIASAACLVLAALAEALPTHSITQQEQRWISSGGHILIVSTSDDGVIDGAACDGLATLSGVEGAFGARRAAVPLVEASRPGSVFAATLTTPGVVDFFTLYTVAILNIKLFAIPDACPICRCNMLRRCQWSTAQSSFILVSVRSMEIFRVQIQR